MAEKKTPLRARSFAELTPEQARQIAAEIAPDLRGGIAERLREALTFHQEMGEVDAARFCMLLRGALHEAAPEESPLVH